MELFQSQEGTGKFHTYRAETIGAAMDCDLDCNLTDPNKEAMVREMLERIADKWTLLVIEALDRETDIRFSRLQERVGNISQKMLTKTLRQLERDGLVTRRVHPTVPPRVDYRLTPLGESLGDAVCGMWIWVEKYVDAVEEARRTFDAQSRTSAA
jgi:DNA-binding HxlR family transcriptional regulator